MNKKIFWPFLFVFVFLVSFSASCEEKFSKAQVDSIRKEFNNQTGLDKISTQLELALRIMENDHVEARGLANSALIAAKTANNKNLEMRAYFVLGRISEFLDKRSFRRLIMIPP